MTHPAQLRICLLSPGLPHDGNTLATKSLGGSETSGVLVAKALAQRGHIVTVLSPCEQGSVAEYPRPDGPPVQVQYLPIAMAPQYLSATPHDAVIISRALEAVGIPTPHATVKILWCHDLALKRQRQQLAGILCWLDAIYAPSKFHCDQLRQIHPLLADDKFGGKRVVQTRNGLDLAAFAGLDQLERDPWKLVYGSRPERGLGRALDVMDELARRGQPWTLHVSSYDNTPPQLVGMYEQLWARCQAMPNVVLHGALPQTQWREHLATARALLYPSDGSSFREVFAIVVAEAQAAGTPVVCVAKGALPETLHPDAGILLGDDATDVTTSAFLTQFCDAIATLTDEATWTRMSTAGRAHGATLDWTGVAAQWEQDIRERIARRNDAAARVRAHLARQGEREAVVE